MTQPERSNEMLDDPSGSIFLPRSEHPEREFESWYFQLMLGRGIARDKTIEEVGEIHEALIESRRRHLAGIAVTATAS